MNEYLFYMHLTQLIAILIAGSWGGSMPCLKEAVKWHRCEDVIGRVATHVTWGVVACGKE